MGFSDDNEDVTGISRGKTTDESQRKSVSRRVSFGRPSNLSVSAKTSSANDLKPMLSVGRRDSLDTHIYRQNNPRQSGKHRRGSLGSIESAPANMTNQPSADAGTTLRRNSASAGRHRGSTIVGSAISGAGLAQTKMNISVRRRSSLQNLACCASPTLATSVRTYADDDLSEMSRSDYCIGSDKNYKEKDNFTTNSFSIGTSSRISPKWMDHDTSLHQRARRSATMSHIPSISQPLCSSPSYESSSDETVKACNKTGSNSMANDDASVLATQKKEVLQSLADLDFEIQQTNEYIDQLKDRRRTLQREMEDASFVLGADADGAKKDEAWAIPAASRSFTLDSMTVHEKDYNGTGQGRAA